MRPLLGYEVDYEGDAFFYAFSSAKDAVSVVSEAMQGLAEGPASVRVGIHTGEPELDPPKYVGIDVHKAARIMASAHGGQVVLLPSIVSATGRAEWSRQPSAGLGENVRACEASLIGSGLELEGELIQLSAFRSEGGRRRAFGRIARPSRRR